MTPIGRRQHQQTGDATHPRVFSGSPPTAKELLRPAELLPFASRGAGESRESECLERRFPGKRRIDS